MTAIIQRRHFLMGASALALQACASPGVGAKEQLGHIVVGQGPQKVLVLHEWLGDHSNYDAVVPYLSPDLATYVFADLRGYGLSRAMTGSYSLEEAAADAVALMNSLGFDQYQVVGHSMTGMLAQYLALTQPERVTGIVLISPVPPTGFKTDAAGIAKLRAVIYEDGPARGAITARTGNRYGEAWLRRKVAMLRRASPQAMEGYMRMFVENDFSDKVASIRVPVSAILGAQDLPFYRQASIEPMFRRWYRDLRVGVIQDAGHYSMLETPVLLASQIERAVFGQPLVSDA